MAALARTRYKWLRRSLAWLALAIAFLYRALLVSSPMAELAAGPATGLLLGNRYVLTALIEGELRDGP